MLYREFTPRQDTRSFLHCLWTLETSDCSIQRIVPDGRPELIVNLCSPCEALHDGSWRLQPRAFLAGQITGPFRIRPSGETKILGARFRPQGAARVFPLAMSEITGAILPLEVRYQSIEELESDLERRAGPADPIVDEAVRRMMSGTADIAGLAVELQCSARHFERRFKRAVGLSPKLFCRIQRFQRVFQELEAGGNWVETALACGYYDQAHLVRDMREFSGEAPSALVNGDELARHFLSHSSNTRAPRAP
jgi:AraC-like DNA-binding protein